MDVIKAQAIQKDWINASPDATFLYTQVIAPDGTLWAADSVTDTGKNGSVYHFSLDGKVISKIKLLPPGALAATTETPKIQTMLIANDKLWMADFAMGTLYRYDIKGTSDVADIIYISPAVSGTGQPIQFWGLAFQQANPDTDSKDLVWFNDTNSGELFAIDANSPPRLSANPAPVVKLNLTEGNVRTALDMIYDKDGKCLWVIMANVLNQAENVLLKIPAKKNIAKGDIEKISIGGAISLASLGQTLIIGTSTGMIHKLDLRKGAAKTLESVTLPHGTKTKKMPHISSLTQDSAQHIWAVDSQQEGELYEIYADQSCIVQYTLANTSNKVYPTSIIWSSQNDTLYIADRFNKGRVMVVTPLGSVTPDGKATYQLLATPDTETVDINKKFNFTLAAKLTSGATVPLNVLLTVKEHGSATAEFTGHGKQYFLSVPSGGIPINTLTAGSKSGEVVINAKSRGMIEKPVFTGKIKEPVTKISIFPPDKKIFLPKRDYILQSSKVTLEPASSTEKITLTIESASQVKFGNGLTTVQINPGEPVPPIRTGSKAGKFTITASAAGKSDNISLKITPYPTSIKTPVWSSLRDSDLQDYNLTNGDFFIMGHAIDNDSHSVNVPVEGWKLQLIIDEKYPVKFSSDSGSDTKEIFIITDEQGKASLKYSGKHINMKNVTEPFYVAYKTISDEEKDKPFVEGSVLVTILP